MNLAAVLYLKLNALQTLQRLTKEDNIFFQTLIIL